MDKSDLFAGLSTLDVIMMEWKLHHEKLRDAIVPLAPEQLALRAAPGLRTIGEKVSHIIATRVYWFNGFLGEEAPHVGPMVVWDDEGQPARPASDLVYGLDQTWQFVQGCLHRWTPEDLAKTFPREFRGDAYVLPRSWVVWHVLEHDLHHGGEVSLTLGIHGLQGLDV